MRRSMTSEPSSLRKTCSTSIRGRSTYGPSVSERLKRRFRQRPLCGGFNSSAGSNSWSMLKLPRIFRPSSGNRCRSQHARPTMTVLSSAALRHSQVRRDERSPHQRFPNSEKKISAQARFDDIAQRPGGKSFFDKFLILVNGQKDNLALGPSAYQQACGFQTVQHAHGNIEYEDIRSQRVCGLKKGLTSID